MGAWTRVCAFSQGTERALGVRFHGFLCSSYLYSDVYTCVYLCSVCARVHTVCPGMDVRVCITYILLCPHMDVCVSLSLCIGVCVCVCAYPTCLCVNM